MFIQHRFGEIPLAWDEAASEWPSLEEPAPGQRSRLAIYGHYHLLALLRSHIPVPPDSTAPDTAPAPTTPDTGTTTTPDL